jgi:hypothetical protein
MNSTMNKYINAYHNTQGSELEKVKYILMIYAHTWDWHGQDALIADLIDDQNITADAIVEFLESIYTIDGGNKEFSSALKVLKL